MFNYYLPPQTTYTPSRWQMYDAASTPRCVVCFGATRAADKETYCDGCDAVVHMSGVCLPYRVALKGTKNNHGWVCVSCAASD